MTQTNIGEIIRIFEEPFEIKRGGTPVIDPTTGRLIQPVPDDDDKIITGVVYRASARDLLALPEGIAVRQAIIIFSQTYLHVSDSQRGKVGDTVIYNGEDYEVRKSEDWDNLGHFFKMIAVRKEP